MTKSHRCPANGVAGLHSLDDEVRNFINHNWPTLVWATVVFVVAVLIRLPSCYESFWVDELHTAWAIWGDMAQVAERAEVGNQTPLYFQAMWIWRWLVGDSEVALRMSSVLAVAAASALLVVGVRQSTGRVSAGVVSGAVLAVDSNSLFFGTEFRPYAFIMLSSVIATWAAVGLIQGKTKVRGGNLRLILVAAISLAVLIHPTSIVTLGLLPIAVLIFVLIDRGLSLKLQVSDLVSMILIAAVGFSLAKSSLGHSWEIRDQWAAFGRATSPNQLWTIWPWWILAITPGVIALLSLRNRSFREVLIAKLPMLVAVVATTVFFAASYFDWVPLWHRRYFVAVLPLFAWSIGACFALPMAKGICRVSETVVVVAGAFLIATMLWNQGTIQQWQKGQTQLIVRGEDWRSAVNWLRSEMAEDENSQAYVDAALIESAEPRRHVELVGPWADYFMFPVLGPYSLENCQTLTIDANMPKLDTRTLIYPGMRSFKNQSANWLISRSSRSRIDRWLESHLLRAIERRSFGPVHVIRYEYLLPNELGPKLKEMGFSPPAAE
ncbi:glycosyltransferase family 39 protein [Planctomycetes bacterium K23_9]|uniref:Uncharacterized protein n=1 Tax=Stieleria marina TaxID=1930275 RepID=A0A517NNZ9_9BACT|nr:hypothetical protein K239x_07840 [Planctomycetes bacterium K23_9]